MSLRDQLQAIYETHGQLTPRLVVDEARAADHPLHQRFEWDDAIAGEAWRRDQAHRLIQSVQIVYAKATETSPEKRVRAFHAVRSEKGNVYEPVMDVIKDPFMRELVLRDMERAWKDMKARFEGFDEFWALVRQDVA